MKGKKWLIALAIVILIIAAVIGFGQFQQQRQGDGEVDVENPVSVETTTSVQGSLSEVTKITAVVEAKDMVSLVPKIGGRVEQLPVSVGDRVKAGQVVVRLDQGDILAQLRQAEAGVATAKSGKASALARYEDARVTLERMEKLYEEGAVSMQQLEQARLQYELSDPKTIDAQIRQAQAGADTIRAQLANTVITTPIAGVVTAVNVSRGEMAGPSMPAVVVMNLDELDVVIGVVEQYISYVQLGDAVDVTIRSVREEPFAGVVQAIAPAADSMTRSFPVTIRVDNREQRIKAGMFAEISLVTKTKENVVLVPMVAVVDQGSRQTIFIVEEDRAISRQIELGINDGQSVEVVSGVEPGEAVIVKGQNIVNHGDLVRLQGGE